MHALMNKLAELPDAPRSFRPIAGHAVALPDVDLESAGARLRLIGAEIEPDLVFDRAKLPSSSSSIGSGPPCRRTTASSRTSPGSAGPRLNGA